VKYVYFRYPSTSLLEVEARSILEADDLFLDDQRRCGPVQPIERQANIGCMPRVPVNARAFPSPAQNTAGAK
jgi:hypothetical protein